MNVFIYFKIFLRIEFGDGIKIRVMFCEFKEFGQVMIINVFYLRGNKLKI